jgi:hypothetical protein
MTASVLQARMTPFRILPEEGLFSAVVMRVFAIVNDGVQKRAQDSHSAFDKEKRFKPEVRAVACRRWSNKAGKRQIHLASAEGEDLRAGGAYLNQLQRT